MKTKFDNEVELRPGAFLPVGDKMQSVRTTKWSKYAHPEYARFKAVVYWANSNKSSFYFSYEGAKNMTEEQGYADIMRRVIKGKNPDTYTSIVLYMNDTNDLRTSEKNFSWEISCYCAGQPIRSERAPIFDKTGSVDIRATKDRYLNG